MSKTQQVKVKRDEEKPEPLEIIAASIIELSQAMKKINASKVKPRVLHLLLRDMTGLPLGQIELVLNSITLLEKAFIKS